MSPTKRYLKYQQMKDETGCIAVTGWSIRQKAGNISKISIL